MQNATARTTHSNLILRWLLFTLLGVFVLFYLMPLFVMLTTSLKTLEEIRTGDLIALPREVTFDAWRIAGTIGGLIFVHVVYGLGFTTLFFRNYYVSIPNELTRAAKVDGAGFFRIFWSIFLPLSVPIVVVTVIWQFTQIWNDFLFGVSFSQSGTQPITVALNNIVNSTTGVKEYNVDMAAAIIAAVPTLLVYVVAGKYFIRGLTAGSVKG